MLNNKAKQWLFLTVSLSVLLLSSGWVISSKQKAGSKPNIIIINLDDLGYGDMGAYGGTGVKTPNMDKLANGGVRFTNGYATSSTCTPSRFALVTGVYPWRNKDAKILPGTAPLLIDTAQITIPKVLKKAGYATGIVGKWHMGLGNGNTDWNKKIKPGPNEVGFDYSYIMAATQDRVPTVYIENNYVVGLDPKDPIEVSYEQNFNGEPTGKENPELLKMKWHHGHDQSIVNGISRIGYMKGGAKAKWIDEDMADVFLAKALQFVSDHKSKPFFLYYTMHQPHVPRTPNPRFEGSTGMGPRGDAIAEADWCLGELLKTLEKESLLENTLIVFTSDNGPVVNDGYEDDAVEKLGQHKPSGPLRGGKYSLYEAGFRVPLITYWKGQIKPMVSDAVVCQLDLLTSLANLVGEDVKGLDSQNHLNTFLGKNKKGRTELILEASSRTALRQGDWVLIPPYDGPAVNKMVNIELGNSKEYQLFNLKSDLAQVHNVAQSQPAKLKQMIKTFNELQKGIPQKNIETLKLE